MKWPYNKKFAFTIFDDTDNATIQKVKPVYDLLNDLGFRTTKSVWVYPPRGNFQGSCLQDSEYLHWILELQSTGFEIALHNIGDGIFNRDEILQGLEVFFNHIGKYPTCHTNHVSNPDNIYWLKDRFEWPLNFLYNIFYRLSYHRPAKSDGSNPNSSHFWGDAAKQHIKYIRNHTFNEINTIKLDPKMPYPVHRKRAYSNKWFSSSDGHTLEEMNELLEPWKIDQLKQEGGACLVYTHFASGFVDTSGRLDPLFRKQMEYLADQDGWFVPVTPLLDHMAQETPSEDPGYLYRLRLDWHWFVDRVRKRFRHGR